MKTFTKIIPRSWPAILALIFLCSCYEFVYITQEDDVHPLKSLQTKISIHLMNSAAQPAEPYFGILMPVGWSITTNFEYARIVDGLSVKVGIIEYSHELTMKMQNIEPAPKDYFWWVGIGNTPISSSGIYNVFPKIQTGLKVGSFEIDYMIGDSHNGLNQLRSGVKKVEVIGKRTPFDLQVTANKNSTTLDWKAPSNQMYLLGYDIYRNGHKINSEIVHHNTYIDENLPSGHYEYTVFPVYSHGFTGTKSIPANICFAIKGSSILFDGINDKVLVYDRTSLQIAQTISLEAWIKPEETNNMQPSIISKYVHGTGYNLDLINYGSYYRLQFILPVGKIKSNQSLYNGHWYHIAAVYDGEMMKLYINAKLDTEYFANGPLNTNNLPLMIGGNSSETNTYFKGNIDDVRIWNVARSESQIKNYFSKTLTGSEYGLAGYWQMDEGCKYRTCDISPAGNDGYLAGSCWCGKDFPFVEDTYSQTTTQVIVPIKNLYPGNQTPASLEFEINFNPQILEFQGILIENTQLANCDKVMTFYNPNGTVRVLGLNNSHNLLTGNVLAYVKLKPLNHHTYTTLNFNSFKWDGVGQRVFSGLVVANDCGYKSESQEYFANDNRESTELMFKIYPNPAINELNVELMNVDQPVDLKVIDLLGQVIYQDKIMEPRAHAIYIIDVTQFKNGVYMLSVTSAGNRSVKKFNVN
jgi:hypothetical protein